MAYNPALDHQAVVADVRATFGATPSLDECVLLCATVCHRLHDLGETDAGLIAKTPPQNGGYGPDGGYYGKDIIIYSDGQLFDCLIAAGAPGTAQPSWQALAPVSPSLWRPAFPLPARRSRRPAARGRPRGLGGARLRARAGGGGIARALSGGRARRRR